MQSLPNPNGMPEALEGVRVLDCSQILAGPFCSMLLADMGADVIKIEKPNGGDDTRRMGPPFIETESAAFLAMNRNKRSIVLDFKDTDDRATLDRLIATADVVVTNMRRSALARLGLDEAGVRAVKPDVIYCIANGYGSDGPKADDAAYDDVIQAASGLASMFSWVGDEPRLVPSIYADKITGVHVAFAISSALHGRARTGKGCSIEVPMAETMAAFNMVEHLSGHTFEPHLGSFSYNRIRTPHRKPRQTTDGWIVILPYSDDNWQQFWTFGERPDYLDDERFATQSKRVDHADALYSLLDGIIAMKSTVEWLGFCAEHSIPASEVIELEHLGDDPHFAAVELIRSDVHPTEGAYRYVRDPIRIDGTTAPLRHHAPRLGADTDAILGELE